jgi:type IV pilus assembly protein PilN
MIRINLLGVERQKAPAVGGIDPAQRTTIACGLVLVAGLAVVGWWYWSLGNESARVDQQIAAAQQEAARLQSLLAEVEQFEQQRTQLTQRVQLIEQLRNGQSVPVQLLDHVNRSLPDQLWLTDMEQDGSVVTMQGRATTLVGVSDFVANLGTGSLLQRPIDIVNTQMETVSGAAQGQQPIDLIRFTVRASLAAPGGRGAAPAAGRGAAPGAR